MSVCVVDPPFLLIMRNGRSKIVQSNLRKRNFLNLCIVGDFFKGKTVKGTRYYVDTFPRLMDPDHQNVGLCVCVNLKLCNQIKSRGKKENEKT